MNDKYNVSSNATQFADGTTAFAQSLTFVSGAKTILF